MSNGDSAEGVRSGLFAWLGRVVVKHPWWVIGAWVVIAVGVIASAPALPTTTDESSFLPQSYESIKAINLQDKAFPQQGEVVSDAAIIVFARADGGKLTSGDTATVDRIVAELNAKHIRNIDKITAGQPSSNGLVQAAAVAMPKSVVNSGSGTASGDAIKTLRADIKPMVAGTGLYEGVTGSAAQNLDSRDSFNRADQIVLVATLGLILILLLIIFRSPIIALLPLITIAIVSQVATGLIADVNKALNLNADSSISTILIVVLFGIGTDYILFLMFRYRERLRAGEDPKQAMVSAVTRVGEVISSAAGVVIFAFLALTLSTLSVLRSMGPALAIAVATTLVAGLTLVPAVVSLLGTRVFWPSKAWRREPKAARFAAIGGALGKHPAGFAVVSGLVLVALAIGAFGFKPTFDLSSSGIPSTAESQVALKTLEKGLPPGSTDPTDVYLHSTSGRLPAGELASYRSKLESLHGVGSVAAPLLSTDGATADYRVTLSYDPQSTQAVDLIKNTIRPGAHAAAPAGTYALVGGTTAVFADIQRAVNHDYAVVFPVAAVIILLILALLLRSLVAPWYLLVSVGLGFGATLGASVLVFQNLRGQAGLVFLLPIYMYLFVVALGTDYNILMVARLREEAREGRDPRQAAAMALRHSGPTIGAAGLILAGTFASLMLAGNQILSQIGFAVSCGIVLAAFVMAMFFAPSVTALIGHRAWWPGHGDEPAARELASAGQRGPALRPAAAPGGRGGG